MSWRRKIAMVPMFALACIVIVLIDLALMVAGEREWTE